MIHDPFRLMLKESARRMNVYRLTVDQCSIPFLRVFLGRVTEEAGADRLLHSLDISSARDHVQLVSIHDAQQLLSDILKQTDHVIGS